MTAIRDDKLLREIALKLKRLREAQGISQQELHNETGVHVGRLETGNINITVSTVSVLCRYFGISLQEFFSDINGSKK